MGAAAGLAQVNNQECTMIEKLYLRDNAFRLWIKQKKKVRVAGGSCRWNRKKQRPTKGTSVDPDMVLCGEIDKRQAMYRKELLRQRKESFLLNQKYDFVIQIEPTH